VATSRPAYSLAISVATPTSLGTLSGLDSATTIVYSDAEPVTGLSSMSARKPRFGCGAAADCRGAVSRAGKEDSRSSLVCQLGGDQSSLTAYPEVLIMTLLEGRPATAACDAVAEAYS